MNFAIVKNTIQTNWQNFSLKSKFFAADWNCWTGLYFKLQNKLVIFCICNCKNIIHSHFLFYD